MIECAQRFLEALDHSYESREDYCLECNSLRGVSRPFNHTERIIFLLVMNDIQPVEFFRALDKSYGLTPREVLFRGEGLRRVIWCGHGCIMRSQVIKALELIP